jgi:hypothetical protein
MDGIRVAGVAPIGLDGEVPLATLRDTTKR